MNTTFLLTPPVRLQQALESDFEGGGASFDPLTRRRFLKRTGGTTVAALVAWNMATQKVSATENGNGSDDENEGGSSGSEPPPPPGPNEAITKTTGVYTPTADTSLPGSIVVTGSSTYAQTVPIRWVFSYKVKLGGEAQQSAVATDCASCEVYEVQLRLAYTGAPLNLPPGKSYNLPSIAGPSHKRGYDVTNNGSCPNNPLASVGTIEGELDAATNNITIKIVGSVSPNDPGPTKTIKWEITPTNNINIATLKSQYEQAIDALYSNAHTVTVNLPNVAMSGDERYQTITAICTHDEVDDGAGCSFP